MASHSSSPFDWPAFDELWSAQQEGNLARVEEIMRAARNEREAHDLAMTAFEKAIQRADLSVFEALAPFCLDWSDALPNREGVVLLEALARSEGTQALACFEFVLPQAEWSSDALNRSLIAATIGGNESIARLLLPQCDPMFMAVFEEDESGAALGMTAFLAAVLDGGVKWARELAPLSDLSARTHQGRNALHVASSKSEIGLPMASFLLDLGVFDLRAKDKNGNTALMLAAMRKNEPIVKLLAPGSDLEQKNQHGKTALDLALLNNAPAEVVDWLASPALATQIPALLEQFGATSLPRALSIWEQAQISEIVLSAGGASEGSLGADSARARPPAKRAPRAL